MTTIALQSVSPIIKNRLLLITILLAPMVLIMLIDKVQEFDPTIGVLDAGIWQLLLLGILSFVGLIILAWWLLQKAWVSLGLPKTETFVSQFNYLTLWQQFVFYWASFALLVVAAMMSLNAVF